MNETSEAETAVIKVDKDLCTRCGLCRKSCGSKWIWMNDDGYPVMDMDEGCIDCGHCVAVCPTGAISNIRMDDGDFKDMVDPGITIDAFTHLTRNRRSIRDYLAKPVKQEHVDKLLNCVRYIPTGSNLQSLEYLVITNENTLQDIKEYMAKKFELTYKIARIFRFAASKQERLRLKQQVNLWRSGNDNYLRNAPCLLVIYSKKNYFGIPAWDAGIASHNIDLAAQTLGLGTMLNGFFVVTCKVFKGLKRIAGVPKNATVLAAMTLGYPDISYKRTVHRKPLNVAYR